MKQIKLISFVLIINLLLFACKPDNKETGLTETSGEEVQKSEILVRTMSLKRTNISRTIDYSATLQAYEEVYIAPATPGRIEKIYVEPGDAVRKGDKLFLMDQTQLYQTQIQLRSIEVDINRMETLLETGSITQQAYDQLKTQYDITKSSLRFLSDNTLLHAPFSGVITAKYYEDGEIYSGAPNTQAGKACIVTLMQVNPLKAVLNISEKYYPLVKNGMKATVIADVLKDEEFDSEVILVYPVINPNTRSFQVEIEVPNSSNRIKPGMFARVSMFVDEEEAYIVAANTVLQQQGTNIRYLFVEKDGVAKRYNVTIGKRFDDKIEIVSDKLMDGDMVVVDGQTKLMNDDKIKVVK